MTANPDTQRPRRKKGPSQAGRPARDFQESMVVTGGRLSMPGFRNTAEALEWTNADEVIRTKGFDVYDQMQHDDQVKVALAMKTALVAGRKYDVKPASDSAQDKEVAQFVKSELDRIGFNKVMREACTMFKWGYAMAEVVWTLKEEDGQQFIGIKKVAYRDPKQLFMFTDVHGNMKQVRQYPDTFGIAGPINLPMDRLYHVVYQGEFGNPYGVSDLRAAYKNWWAKKFTIQFWNVYNERIGAPLMAVKYPMGAPPDLKANIKKILKGLSSKTEIMIPEGVVFELIEASRSGTADFMGALQYHDVAIAKAILLPALLGFQAGAPARGSDSQSRLHLKTLFSMTGAISDHLLRTFSEQVVKKLIDFNYDVKKYPTIVWGDYGEYEAFEISDAIRLLHAAGILEMDGTDVNYTRGLLGLPIRDEDNEDEVIRPPEPPPPASANAPPPPAQQGNQQGQGRQRRASGGSSGASGGQGAAGAR